VDTNQPDTRPKIFLSYARQDYNLVQLYYKRLNAATAEVHYSPETTDRVPAFDIWFDQVDIPPTSRWAAEIQHGLDECDAVLLIASQFSMASPNVRDEWLYAMGHYAKDKKADQQIRKDDDRPPKPVYIWLVDNAELDDKLKNCPLIDLRVDPLDGRALNTAIEWLNHPDSPPYDAATPPDLNTTIRPDYINAHRRMIVGLQLVWAVIHLLVFGLITLNEYRTVAFYQYGDTQIPSLITLPFLALLAIADWAIFFRHIKRFSRRWLPYGHMMAYYAGTVLFKLLIPLLLTPPFTLSLGLWLAVQWALFFPTAIIARNRSSIVARSRPLWTYIPPLARRQSTAKRSHEQNTAYNMLGSHIPEQSRWFPAYPVRKPPTPAATETSSFHRDAPTREIVTGGEIDRIIVLYDEYDTYFAQYLAAAFQHQPPVLKLLSDPTITAMPVSAYTSIEATNDLLYLVISPHSLSAMTRLVQQARTNQRFILVLLQETDIPEDDDTLSRYQWVDARSNYERAIGQLHGALPDIPRNPPPKRHLLSATQPHPNWVFGSFLFLGGLPLMTAIIALPVLLVSGIILLTAVLTGDSISPNLVHPVLSGLFQILAAYLLFTGYWQRRYSLPLIIATALIFFIEGANLASWPVFMLAIGLFVIATLKLSRLPRMLEGRLQGFEFIEMFSLGIWRPKKRFEWPLLIVLVLLAGGSLLTNDSIDLWPDSTRPTALQGGAPVLRDLPPDQPDTPSIPRQITPSPYTGAIEVPYFAVGLQVMESTDNTLSLTGASTRFAEVQTLHGLIWVRHIERGTDLVFTWYHNGDPQLQETHRWDFDVDWSQAANIGQVSTGITQTDGTLLPAGDYTLTVTVDGALLAETAFTIES
jgi:hypothetical protein